MNDEACSCLNRGSQCVSDWREGVCSGEQGCAFGNTYHPQQKQSHACPESSMASHRRLRMSMKQKGKVLLLDGEWKAEKKTVTFILKREEFVCFLVSFHVCVYILHVRALRTHRVIFFSFCLCSFIAACTSSSLHFHVATDHGYSSRNEGPVWAVYISLTAQKHWHQLTELCWNDWWRSGQQLARRPQA